MKGIPNGHQSDYTVRIPRQRRAPAHRRAGGALFVGKDVAKVLGYKDTFDALKKHVDNEDKQNRQHDSFDSPRGMTIIN